jgi:pimeloyl-ACP methyl ester carboxylesterase
VDYCSRIAGLMLVGGSIDRIREPSWFLPVYIVNGEPDVIAKYEKVNGVDALRKEGAKVTRYNKVYPLRQVSVVTCDDLAAAIDDCYWNMFLTAQRGQEVTGGLYSASTPYQGYGSDCAPYSLSKRNPVIDGKTREGICFFPIVSEAYSDIKTAAGEYLQTWYEYLPEEAINGKAPDHTIPMILALHGGGDDPRQFVEGQGFLELAGRERIAIVAPEKANLHTNVDDGREYLSTVLPMLVRDTLAKYPAIDPSRVYVTGYSMGSLATGRAMLGAPELFAAAYPQCGGFTLLEGEEEHFKINGGIELPMIVTTAEYNFGFYTNVGARLISQANIICELNGMDPIPEPDFDKYPVGGFDADLYTAIEINDDYVCHTFMKANAKGIPMVGVMYMEGMVHCLYPQYSEIMWDFFKHYSRNQETLEIEYNPYVR